MSEFDSIDAATIASLAVDGTKPEIITIETGGLGDPSLPAKIVAGWDRKQQRFLDVTDIVNKWRKHPTRRRGTSVALTLDSFTDLVNRHKTPDSVIFADTDWNKPALLAVIDYHPIRDEQGIPLIGGEGGETGVKDADFGEFRVLYDFPLSQEWQDWKAGNGAKMNQGEFAYLIEDRIPYLVSATEGEAAFIRDNLQTDPATPSQMLMLARGLQINVDARYVSAKILQSGEGELTYSEQHNDASGAKLKIPGAFVAKIPLFRGGESVRVVVRLRYRVANSIVSWFYDIYRPDVLIGERVTADVTKVGEATDRPIFEGRPEK